MHLGSSHLGISGAGGIWQLLYVTPAGRIYDERVPLLPLQRVPLLPLHTRGRLTLSRPLWTYVIQIIKSLPKSCDAVIGSAFLNLLCALRTIQSGIIKSVTLSSNLCAEGLPSRASLCAIPVGATSSTGDSQNPLSSS